MKSLIILLCFLFILCGCSKNATSSIKQIQEDGAKPLRVVVDLSRSYDSCRLENEEFVGTEIDLIKRLASRMNREITIKSVAFVDIIPTIKAGKADIGISRIVVTAARLNDVDFSDSYGEGGNSFLYYKGENEPKISYAVAIDDKIGTLNGTFGDFFLSEQRCVSVKYDTLRDAFNAFEKKEIASLFINRDEAEAFVKNKTNASEYVITPREMREEYSIAIAKNRNALLNAVNEALAQEGSKE